jgi:hypothetical protein
MELDATIYIMGMDGNQINDIGGEPASRELRMSSDRYKSMLGDGNANVRVGLSEKFAGPYGYSSVRLDVTVSIRCDQTTEAIQQAKAAAYEECLVFMDHYIGSAYTVLKDHLETHMAKED